MDEKTANVGSINTDLKVYSPEKNTPGSTFTKVTNTPTAKTAQPLASSGKSCYNLLFKSLVMNCVNHFDKQQDEKLIDIPHYNLPAVYNNMKLIYTFIIALITGNITNATNLHIH